jgi:hypothetical protein
VPGQVSVDPVEPPVVVSQLVLDRAENLVDGIDAGVMLTDLALRLTLAHRHVQQATHADRGLPGVNAKLWKAISDPDGQLRFVHVS